ncbi:winged helix-turn-helix transcriptional regulator [Rahnella contaminans]|uniref:winged helix-turn-helix transcriptional regulator n=1 Tax=Rahnella contaminans TaxID=2703882 RepID=UPI003C2C4506
MSGNAVPKAVTQVNCRSASNRLLLDQITDKWAVLILTVLCAKPLRFNEIRRCLDGITQKSLTQSLRRLERNGIVARRVIPSSQIAVEYSITPLGRTLEAPFQALYAWTLNHSADVIQAQTAFDEREAE